MSDQEDLTISAYVQLGCLKLHPEKQYFLQTIQIDHYQSYQIYASPEMSIELCFRLCRQSIVFLLLNNQSQCLCLHASTKYFGEILPNDQCSTDDHSMFSLSENPNLLPTFLSPDDWAVDGCYYLQGVDKIQPNYWLYALPMAQALDFCRKHCEKVTQQGSYSFALSRPKSCYCLPMIFRPLSEIQVLRKPLSHCSFIRQICSNASDHCQTLASKVHPETFVKVDVQKFCSSTDSLEFRYDRTLKMCYQSLMILKNTTFIQLVQRYRCLPLLIQSEEQWKNFLERFKAMETSLLLWINPLSLSILNRSMSMENAKSLVAENLCLFIEKSNFSVEIRSCDQAPVATSMLCFQQSVNTTIPFKYDFPPIKTGEKLIDTDVLTCPNGFVLFNRLCYFIETSFIYNRAVAEDLCLAQFEKSSLVEFDSHDPFNLNNTEYLGRTYEDTLLEFFYYRLEHQLRHHTNSTGKKHWLRLLLGERNEKTKCVLRYFTRLTGAFSVLHQCFNGGHPVCQCEPIRKSDERSLIPIVPFLLNTTQFTDIIADEDLINETTIDLNTTTMINEVTTEKYRSFFSRYRTLIVILTGPVLALAILFGGIISLVIYLRSDGVSVMRNDSIPNGSQRRTKRSSTIMTNSDAATGPPSVVFIRSRSIADVSVSADAENSNLLFLLDERLPKEDQVEILSPSIIDTNMIDEREHLIPNRSSSSSSKDI